MGLALATPVVAAGCGGSTNKQSASASTAGPPPDSGRDATIMIIRHGEKPSSGDPGFDETGKQDKKSLTRQGWERSHALPRLFARTANTAGSAGSAAAGSASSADSAGSARSASTAGSAGLPRPSALYAAADQGPHAGAHRMRQTVTPLGAALHVRVNTEFAEGEEKELAAAALAAASPVLICWEHSKIPSIVEALGAAQVAGVPEEWPDRFDLVWVFTRRAGTWTFQSVPQHLLPSDA
ncbi:hypothetical protein [Streptomyces xanthochromogenes]|uniref:hypothetical protein n=1 Tax=Streptomyces xanthochromogenes TaxID=67384 RepID=UPI00167436D3|nr:hypothetical protein [Streptomyces xanthochromogenes]